VARKTTLRTLTKPIKQPLKGSPEYYKSQMVGRFWMTLNYLTIPFTSALIFGFSALCEYLLFRLVWSLLASDIQQSPAIKDIAQWTQIAVAAASLVGAIIHSGFSLYGTIQVERQFAQQDDR